MPNPNYSIVRTIWKGIKSILVFLIPLFLVYLQSTGQSDVKIIDMIIQFWPWLASLTVGGLITAILNWIKNH